MDDQWQVTGNAAETYERALVPAVFAPWAPLVVALTDPQPGERVLDIACGTGLIARLAAERVGRTGNVTGLDLNPGMLSFAASITSPDPATSAPIIWREASATNMPLPDAAFDVVYCQLGLQFFPDRPAAMREMYRVLVPGGRLGTYGVAGHSIQSRVRRSSRCPCAARKHRGSGRHARALWVRRGRTVACTGGCGRFPRHSNLVGCRHRSLSVSFTVRTGLCARLAALRPCSQGLG